MNQYLQLTNSENGKEWYDSVYAACQWIMKKRVYDPSAPQIDGLFPPGFSAEHLGPNDYYYWDNFWGIAGLQAAAAMFSRWKRTELLPTLNREIESWFKSIDKSLISTAGEKRRPIMPASPNRRPDSGSVGSLAAGYPLQLWDPDDERLLLTAGYLIENCCIDHAFYHNISHSGINPYLTLHIAEVLLRASDQRFCDLTETIGALASQSGQWPEAIHPQLKTGCMGDGQHIWAAAEWMIIIRNCFMREEGNTLILCQGIIDKVFLNTKKCTFGYAPTTFGPVKCSISKQIGNLRVEWNGKWFDNEPQIIIKIPGIHPFTTEKGQTQCDVPYKGAE
jgi:hypothetical protein